MNEIIPAQDQDSSAIKSYDNPGLSPAAIRAKRHEEQKNKIYDHLIDISREALDVIHDIAISGEKDADRLNAAKDILNRAGMKQAQEITVRHDNTKTPGELLLEKLANLAPKEVEEGSEDEHDILEAEVIRNGNEEN